MYLKEFREYFKFTQTEVAEKLDIAQSAIARYENHKVVPTATVILKYVSILDANPNYLLLGQEPLLLSDVAKLDIDNQNLLSEITYLYNQNEIHNIFYKILIDKIINKFDNSEESFVLKLLSIIDLDSSHKATPFLFLHYIFQIIDMDKNRNTITNYKKYLTDIIAGYKIFSWKNQPLFTTKIKNEITDFFDLKITEKECELLVKNHKKVLTSLEEKMPASLIKHHRNRFN